MPRGSWMKKVKVETPSLEVTGVDETLGSKPILISQGKVTSTYTLASTSTTNLSHIFPMEETRELPRTYSASTPHKTK